MPRLFRGSMHLIQTLLPALLVLSGCVSPSPAPLGSEATPVHSPAIPTLHPLPSPSPSPTASAAPTASPTRTKPPASIPSSTATQAAVSICSPLEGIPLSELGLPELLKNPFEAPRTGFDDGHHGADFAYWSWGDRKEMLGHPVQSTLDGRVAGVILNRPPYGNAILIETPLENLPTGWLAKIQAPTPAPTVVPATSLFCPASLAGPMANQRSLYLLYAHLQQAPTLQTGQAVTCGERIGEVGTSGNSVNPHLHLETRVGPADITFSAMAHYDNAASEEEMRNYCTWRVSGLFQMFDPMQLISLQP